MAVDESVAIMRTMDAGGGQPPEPTGGQYTPVEFLTASKTAMTRR
jgi:hypothetical protein